MLFEKLFQRISNFTGVLELGQYQEFKICLNHLENLSKIGKVWTKYHSLEDKNVSVSVILPFKLGFATDH